MNSDGYQEDWPQFVHVISDVKTWTYSEDESQGQLRRGCFRSIGLPHLHCCRLRHPHVLQVGGMQGKACHV